MLARIEKDSYGTLKPQDGGEYTQVGPLMEKQWRCVGCATYVDGHNGHLKCWHHLKMLIHRDMEEGGTTRQ